MRDLLHLMRADLRRLAKTPSVPLLWLAFPIALSAIEYGAFGHLAGGRGVPKGTLALVDQDSSMVSGFLKGAMERAPLADFFAVTPLADTSLIRHSLEENEVSAALVIPKGFQDSIFTAGGTELAFTSNPRQEIRPLMVESSLRTFVEVGNHVIHAGEEARREIMRVGKRQVDRESFMAVSGALYDAGQRLRKLGRLRDLEMKVERPAAAPTGPASNVNSSNFFTYFLPGLLLFSLLLVLEGFEKRAFQVRRQGLGRRLAAAPVRRGSILAAEALGMLVGALLCGAVILGLGALLFHIHLQRPLLLFLTLAGFSLFGVGLMKAIFARAHSERAAMTLASVVILLNTLVGGGFMPVEAYSAGMQPFARATPVGSASQALVDVLVHGKDLAGMAPYLLGTWAWGIGLCIVGLALAWRSHERP